jgi:hypothetical protein
MTCMNHRQVSYCMSSDSDFEPAPADEPENSYSPWLMPNVRFWPVAACLGRLLPTLRSGQSRDRLVMPDSRFAAANTAHAEYQGLLERNLLYLWDWRCPPVVIHGVEVDFSLLERMGIADHSIVTFRVFGDDLVPFEVTALLGYEPTTAYSQGDVRIGSKQEIAT